MLWQFALHITWQRRASPLVWLQQSGSGAACLNAVFAERWLYGCTCGAECRICSCLSVHTCRARVLELVLWERLRSEGRMGSRRRRMAQTTVMGNIPQRASACFSWASLGMSVSCPVSPGWRGVLILILWHVLASSAVKLQGTCEDNGYCPAAVGSLEGRGHMEEKMSLQEHIWSENKIQEEQKDGEWKREISVPLFIL